MGLSNMPQGGGAAGAEAGAAPATPTTEAPGGAAPAEKSFGDRLGDYFKNRYPIAGGLAGMVFDPQQSQPATAPLAPMPGGTQQPDYSQMIAQNAQPQQGGSGLGAILKLIGL
jgi:hypothetical protein